MNERSEKGREGGEKPTVPVRPGHRKSRPQWRRLLFPPPSLPLTLRRCLRRPWPHLPLGMLPGAGRRRGRPWGPAFPSGWGVKGGHRSRMGGRGGCLSVERAEVEVGWFQKVVGPLTGGFSGKEPDMNVEMRLDFPTPSSPTTTMRTGLSRSCIIIQQAPWAPGLLDQIDDRSKSPVSKRMFSFVSKTRLESGLRSRKFGPAGERARGWTCGPRPRRRESRLVASLPALCFGFTFWDSHAPS